MICLDTNYLIHCLEAGSEEAERITAWYRRGEHLLAPVTAWYEFLCGPVTAEQEEIVRAFLTEVSPLPRNKRAKQRTSSTRPAASAICAWTP